MIAMKASFLLFLIVLTAACGDENSKARGEFLAGCVHSGLPKSACACMFDKITEKYTVKELQAFDQQLKAPPEAFVQVTMQAAMACRNK